ncbi:ubiquitin carboxyl-terminal hydrolase [Stylonychia lemnae]|uniref:RanBP-type and C3HC4-type zinc finger-containing protein 1 n=1 Tax=Stylonychia lemnae TaxID=5949 RepID=A0A078B2C0_STYLE|nr:ubiquitin carboxyl-terminal hydrolase [Stylonychia lemnae]|eukprot:CDW88639.1 ubiquitin carboxyl-terminal hydrolase [Stylonychia lemnae]
MLHCGHSYCQGCLLNLFRVTHGDIQCPYCQEKHNFQSVEEIKTLIKNYTLLSLVDQRLTNQVKQISLQQKQQQLQDKRIKTQSSQNDYSPCDMKNNNVKDGFLFKSDGKCLSSDLDQLEFTKLLKKNSDNRQVLKFNPKEDSNEISIRQKDIKDDYKHCIRVIPNINKKRCEEHKDHFTFLLLLKLREKEKSDLDFQINKILIQLRNQVQKFEQEIRDQSADFILQKQEVNQKLKSTFQSCIEGYVKNTEKMNMIEFFNLDQNLTNDYNWICKECLVDNPIDKVKCKNCKQYRDIIQIKSIRECLYDQAHLRDSKILDLNYQKLEQSLKIRRKYEQRIISDLEQMSEQNRLDQIAVEDYKWYAISMKWLDQWKNYVQSDKIDLNLVPGQIDNSNLYIHQEANRFQTQAWVIRDDLVRNKDYKMVTELVWDIFNLIYGGGPVISRQQKDIYSKGVTELLRKPSDIRITNVQKIDKFEEIKNVVIELQPKKSQNIEPQSFKKSQGGSEKTQPRRADSLAIPDILSQRQKEQQKSQALNSPQQNMNSKQSSYIQRHQTSIDYSIKHQVIAEPIEEVKVEEKKKQSRSKSAKRNLFDANRNRPRQTNQMQGSEQSFNIKQINQNKVALKSQQQLYDMNVTNEDELNSLQELKPVIMSQASIPSKINKADMFKHVPKSSYRPQLQNMKNNQPSLIDLSRKQPQNQFNSNSIEYKNFKDLIQSPKVNSSYLGLIDQHNIKAKNNQQQKNPNSSLNINVSNQNLSSTSAVGSLSSPQDQLFNQAGNHQNTQPREEFMMSRQNRQTYGTSKSVCKVKEVSPSGINILNTIVTSFENIFWRNTNAK